jgi:hypothetical protein
MMYGRIIRFALLALVSVLVALPSAGEAGTVIGTRVPAGGGEPDFAPGDLDDDGVLDEEDNCPAWANPYQAMPEWGPGGNDDDCDGFNADIETYLGAGPEAHCPATPASKDEAVDAWPPDFDDSRMVSLEDVSMVSPSYNKAPGGNGYNKRFDLDGSSLVSLEDISMMSPYYNKTCADPPPSSEALIAEALEAGTITYEDSLRYRAYALYQSPGLPTQFQSPIVDYHHATELFSEVLDNEASISPQLLADLEPYMARPFEPGSIFTGQPAGNGVTASAVTGVTNLAAANGKVRVWARDADAGILVDRRDRINLIWPHLQAIFPFDNPDTPDGANTVNPDTAIDIYFVDPGTVDPRSTGCNVNPPPQSCRFTGRGYAGYDDPATTTSWASYIMLDKSQTGTWLTADLAHELAHVGQHSYDIYEPFWLKDATAQWAAERVLMELGLATAPEHSGQLPGFFKTLDRRLTRDPHDEPHHRYASWLFFFHASMDQGDNVVTSIWQNAAAPGKQNEDAVDAVYPFIDNFDDFATHNWNQPPVEKVFPLYRGPKPASPLFQTGLKPNLTRTKNFTTTEEEILTNRISRLSAKYFRYTFANNVRKVTFENYIVPQPDAHIWAIPKIGGQWKAPEDWSRDEKKRFCRDYPAEDLQEVIIIVSNSHKTTTMDPGDKLKTKADTEGCKGFIGTATGTYHHACVDPEFECYTQDWTVTANILWEEDEDYFFGCGCRPFFPTGEIDWQWSFNYPDPPCNDAESGTVQAGLPPPNESGQMLILWEDAADMTQWFYSGGGGIDVSWFDDCQNGTGSALTGFMYIPVPDVVPVTPTLPPTQPPVPISGPQTVSVAVPVPPSDGEMSSAATGAVCQATEFSFPRGAPGFSGSCVDEFNNAVVTVSYTWNFTRIGAVAP